jgi:hypothetical protein
MISISRFENATERFYLFRFFLRGSATPFPAFLGYRLSPSKYLESYIIISSVHTLSLEHLSLSNLALNFLLNASIDFYLFTRLSLL